MHPNVHSSITYNSQDTEAIYMSVNRLINNKDIKYIHTHTCTHIHTMEYYSAIKKNEIMPFAATWMNLQNISLSEISKRQTNIVCYHLYVDSKK